jgi:hypothetical protein
MSRVRQLLSVLAVTKDLSPAYFAMIMATGIVSLGAFLLAMPTLAKALFAINMVAYCVLAILTVVRITKYFQRFFSDLIDHQRGPGFFTFVAGSCVLGSQFIIIANDVRIAFVLWALATILWIVLIDAIFTAFSVKEHKPTLAEGSCQRGEHSQPLRSGGENSAFGVALLGSGNAALQIRDRRRHLSVGGIGYAAAVDLDRVHAAKARCQQRLALRRHLFEGHMLKIRSAARA